MRIVVKKVGQKPTVEEVSGSLEDFQQIVGGYIEIARYEGTLLICNEEGRIYGLSPNITAGGEVIVGNIAFVGEGEGDDEGEFVSLTDEQIAMLMKALR